MNNAALANKLIKINNEMSELEMFLAVDEANGFDNKQMKAAYENLGAQFDKVGAEMLARGISVIATLESGRAW